MEEMPTTSQLIDNESLRGRKILRKRIKESSIELARPMTSSAALIEDERRRQEFLDLLYGAAIPLETVCHAFAYGSGAIPQQGEDPREKMVDFILVCNDSLAFHRRNMLLNPAHYSWFLRKRLFSEKRLNNLYWFQRDGFFFPKGARVFYNTMIPTRGRLIKYGVIDTEDFEADLLDWPWLYVAGRLHKPVLNVVEWPNQDGIGQRPNRQIQQAINDNRWMASQAALLLLPSSQFTMDHFLEQIVSLSYKGDVRMGLAEDAQKITKLVDGARDKLRKIYMPILNRDGRVEILSDSRIEHDYSTTAIFHRLQMLPFFVQRGLANSYYPLRQYRGYSTRMDIEELIYFIAHRHDVHQRLDQVLERIVHHSSWQQSLKNAYTAGSRSFAYILPKLRKGIFRRIWR